MIQEVNNSDFFHGKEGQRQKNCVKNDEWIKGRMEEGKGEWRRVKESGEVLWRVEEVKGEWKRVKGSGGG